MKYLFAHRACCSSLFSRLASILRIITSVCAEGIFLTFIEILYLIIIRPRVHRTAALVVVTIFAAGEGELLFLIRFLIVLFSVFIRNLLANFYLPFGLHFCRASCLQFFSLYERRVNTHLFSSRMPFLRIKICTLQRRRTSP